MFVALDAKRELRLRHIFIYGISAFTVSLTLSHTRHDFRKQVTGYKMCVLIFSAKISETFLILWRTERDMVKNVYRSLCTVPLILVRFQWNTKFLDRLLKNTQILNFMKILLVRAVLFCVDRRTDMTKLTAAFRNFANAPKNVLCFTQVKIVTAYSSFANCVSL
jgi:hypothetical protein